MTFNRKYSFCSYYIVVTAVHMSSWMEMEAEGAVPTEYMPFLWQRIIARELVPAAFQSFCLEMVYITSTPIHLAQECHITYPRSMRYVRLLWWAIWMPGPGPGVRIYGWNVEFSSETWISVKIKYFSMCMCVYQFQFSHSVVYDSAKPRTAAHHVSPSITSSRSLLKRTSIESVMPSKHLILCHPLFLPLSIFPSIRVF